MEMTRENTVGIIGAYGMTGRVVARELVKTTDLNLVLGGRNEERALSLAADLGVRTTARHVDIYDEKSLFDFCEPCSVIVNCAAPSSRVLDTVIKGALRTGSHYVDPAGGLDTLIPYSSEFDRANLTGLLYTGWVPGITGLALHHVYSLARESLDTIDSVNVYCEDRSAWSEEAFVDIVEEMLRGAPSGVFQRGVWKDQNLIRATRTYEFPAPIGKRTVYAMHSHELEGLAKESEIPEMGMYAGMVGFWVMLQALFIKMLGRDPEKAARRLRRAWVKAGESLGEDGIVVAEAAGEKQGRDARVRISFYTKESYFVTGAPAALSVRAILEDWVRKKGLNVLCDAVDSARFLAELAKSGVTYEIAES
jgi:saccharopine dehydrogenase-like NADP-dependent oxidoreductase